jgi:hypothetical protein
MNNKTVIVCDDNLNRVNALQHALVLAGYNFIGLGRRTEDPSPRDLLKTVEDRLYNLIAQNETPYAVFIDVSWPNEYCDGYQNKVFKIGDNEEIPFHHDRAGYFLWQSIEDRATSLGQQILLESISKLGFISASARPEDICFQQLRNTRKAIWTFRALTQQTIENVLRQLR